MKKFWVIGLLPICLCACGVNPAERNNVGNALSDQGQYDNAIAAYQAAQVASPDRPEAYYNAAVAYSRNGEFDKAIDALQQSIKTTDVDLRTRAYYNLGNIYFQMSRFDDAVQAYQQALLIDPNDEDTRHNLELAISHLVVPSSTPISPTAQATDEGNSGVTLTSELPDQSTDASPTAKPAPSQSDNLTATPNPNNFPLTISIDDAKSILDAVQQAQQSLSKQALSGTPPSGNSDKDW